MKQSLAFLAALLLAPLAALHAAEKPNILFLFADDKRADTLTAHGNPHTKTPNLDKLAASGFSSRADFCSGGNRGAVCVPIQRCAWRLRQHCLRNDGP